MEMEPSLGHEQQYSYEETIDGSAAAGRSFASIRPDPNAGVSLDEDEVVPPKKISEQELDTYKEQDVSYSAAVMLLFCLEELTDLAISRSASSPSRTSAGS